MGACGLLLSSFVACFYTGFSTNFKTGFAFGLRCGLSSRFVAQSDVGQAWLTDPGDLVVGTPVMFSLELSSKLRN